MTVKKQSAVDEGVVDTVKDVRAKAKKVGSYFSGAPERNMSVADIKKRDQLLKNMVGKYSRIIQAGLTSGYTAGASTTTPDDSTASRVEPTLGRSTSATTPSSPATAATRVEPTTSSSTTAQSLDLNAYKQRIAAEKEAAAKSRMDAKSQINQTSIANQTASAADNELVARVKAEKLKPGYQQDKTLIKLAAKRGIHEKKYQKLNALLESMISLDEADSSSDISQYIINQIIKKEMSGEDPMFVKKAEEYARQISKDIGPAGKMNRAATNTLGLLTKLILDAPTGGPTAGASGAGDAGASAGGSPASPATGSGTSPAPAAAPTSPTAKTIITDVQKMTRAQHKDIRKIIAASLDHLKSVSPTSHADYLRELT
jgi:hypothetical protein